MKGVEPPYSLTAELTHRCPLRCLYCSNPLKLSGKEAELSTSDWSRLFREAAELGIVQINLSGGEPLLRNDLETLIAECRRLDMFTHLVTSGIGLTRQKLDDLCRSGLESIQISLQSVSNGIATEIAGIDVLMSKLDSIAVASSSNLPLTLNVVLHQRNLHEVEDYVRLAIKYGARKLELANTQFYGWALANRQHLIPCKDQLRRAAEKVEQLREEAKGTLEVVWVVSDYHDDFPKPCMGGWANNTLAVMPDGTALPCLAARAIESIEFPSIMSLPLAFIWYESPAFNRFRGFEWMKEPCLSCERRFIDFGGCRCQAFLITGDATEADPVCSLSPHRPAIESAISGTAPGQARLQYRQHRKLP